MNPIRKLYCRARQQFFRLFIPILPYRCPRVLKNISELPGLFRSKGITSVMLVTDESIRRCGLTTALEKLLRSSSVRLTVYDKTVPNPTISNVETALSLYNSNSCQALIGFGGGSSIDCAKAVGARVARPDKKLSQMQGLLKVHHKLPLLIAIPTTAGTGSETTLAAVITDDVTRHKYPINDFCLIPAYAVLDPEITCSLPPRLTATTGLDALTHAVEAYIGGETTGETRKDSIKAVSIIFKYLPRAYNNGNDITARRQMLYAAYLAGIAFTKSYVGYVHAVAHSLGGKYNTPHGLANAVLLPNVLEAYGSAAHHKLSRLAKETGIVRTDEVISDKEAAGRFIDAIRILENKLNIPDRLPEINKEDIPGLARQADREANPLYPVPKLMDAKELEKLYYTVI